MNSSDVFKVFLVLLFGCMAFACDAKKPSEKEEFLNENIEFAAAQTKKMLENVGEPTGENFPRNTNEKGELGVVGLYDWTSGFFPGSLWYLYELTSDELWKQEAEKWTYKLEPLKTYTGNHDLGFMIYCSYGNAERLAPLPEYKDILIESANSLSSRYSENTKAIKSWDFKRGWDGKSAWYYPVIIDNMMNLEMLFYASKVSGDKKYYDIAVAHSESTLKNHFRDDFTTYHVVDLDTITGQLLKQGTHQGFSDNSTWARGQAWAIYGYTMVYRETQDSRYLDAAIKATDVYLKNLPEDLIPLWDFNVGEEGYMPEEKSYAIEFQEKLKDASAAAVVCSALFELGEFAENKSYIDIAVEMLHSLASSNYRAMPGENGNFILKHCVGNLPSKSELDVPIVYADYYFLEALVRYKNMRV